MTEAATSSAECLPASPGFFKLHTLLPIKLLHFASVLCCVALCRSTELCMLCCAVLLGSPCELVALHCLEGQPRRHAHIKSQQLETHLYSKTGTSGHSHGTCT
jgi:hypothetical protein